MRQKQDDRGGGREGRPGDQTQDAAQVQPGRQNPHCIAGTSRRGQHRGAVPPRGAAPEPVLGSVADRLVGAIRFRSAPR